MKTCICDSCAKQGNCPEQFMLRHVRNLMNEHIPGEPVVGGPGDTPWTYEDWGMSVDVHCKRYEYIGEHPICSCITHIGPHKYRFDFTETTRKNKEFKARKEVEYMWRREMREREEGRRNTVYDNLMNEYGIGPDDMGIGYLDM